MKEFWQAFKKFISRGNVVDMAVGVAVATAFTAIVTAFTKGFISPLLALLTEDADLSSLKWIIRPAVSHLEEGAEVIDKAEVAILWGSFLQAVLDFLIVAFVLFCILRVFTRVSKRAAKLAEEAKSLSPYAKAAAEKAAAEKAAAEAKELADAEAAAAEAQAAMQAAEEAEKAERERKQEELSLLRDIKSLLTSLSEK